MRSGKRVGSLRDESFKSPAAASFSLSIFNFDRGRVTFSIIFSKHAPYEGPAPLDKAPDPSLINFISASESDPELAS